jgi:hypothetical protein
MTDIASDSIDRFLKDLSDGLEAISLQILSRVAGMSKDEITALLKDVRKDLANPKIHAYMRVYVPALS